MLILLNKFKSQQFLPPFLPPNDRLMRVSDCEDLWGLFKGDYGVRLPFVLLDQHLDHKKSHVYDQQVHEITCDSASFSATTHPSPSDSIFFSEGWPVSTSQSHKR